MKKAIFAVAGSGKTTLVVNTLDLEKRFLVLTYTDKNKENIENSVIRKFGYIPPNVCISTYFSFLFQFCIRPFRVSGLEKRLEGLFFSNTPPPRFQTGMKRYVTDDGRLYHSLACDFAKRKVLFQKVGARISRFFDCVIVDEVQDFGGYDFDFIELIGRLDGIDALIVGDFFQHTFDTSRNGAKNKTLYDDFEKYKGRVGKYFEIDESSLSVCYRCPKGVCRFIRDNFNISIFPFGENGSDESPIVLRDSARIEEVFSSNKIVKLFYKNSRKYNCYSENWGGSKGLSYDSVCVVLNKNTLKNFSQGNIRDLPPSTKNKLYVACSRTRGKLYFVKEEQVKHFKNS